MEAAVALVRAHSQCHSKSRFISVNLKEPDKEAVLGYKVGDPVTRTASVILLDNAQGYTYEVEVSLDRQEVTRFEHIPGVQPSIIADEFFDCEATVKQDPEVQAALRKRGITDLDLVTVDPWSAGHYGEAIERQLRLRACPALDAIEAGDINCPSD